MSNNVPVFELWTIDPVASDQPRKFKSTNKSRASSLPSPSMLDGGQRGWASNSYRLANWIPREFHWKLNNQASRYNSSNQKNLTSSHGPTCLGSYFLIARSRWREVPLHSSPWVPYPNAEFIPSICGRADACVGAGWGRPRWIRGAGGAHAAESSTIKHIWKRRKHCKIGTNRPAGYTINWTEADESWLAPAVVW